MLATLAALEEEAPAAVTEGMEDVVALVASGGAGWEAAVRGPRR